MLQIVRKVLSPAACRFISTPRPVSAVRFFAASAMMLATLAGHGQSSSSSQTGTTAAPGTAPIQSRTVATQITPQRVATYDEKYEIYGGLSFMNGQAGQNLPKRYNMGGGEVMATYWLPGHLGSHLGIAGDYRLEAGTTPIYPVSVNYGLNRVLVYQNILSGGVNYRGPKNRYAAIDFHALVGATHGTFDSAITGYPNRPTTLTTSYVGLYSNGTSPWGAAGGSIDFNYSPKVAIRLSPDIIFEHFGTETREFASVSGGVVYRIGKRKR
ncbi:MAG: hypothetical protein ACRYFU_10550 [Janthinobacterium lividum]